MQKRSHKLLAATLLRSENGFSSKRFELAFLFGSFQPDCNPLTYLKGSLRAYKFRGHNYSNSQYYIQRQIQRLQRRKHWTMWQYYTLGKLTHYLADAFTFPHNEHYPDTLLEHHQYETDLRTYLESYLKQRTLRRKQFREDVAGAIAQLHMYYQQAAADQRMDVQFIMEATSLLMAGCRPQLGRGRRLIPCFCPKEAPEYPVLFGRIVTFHLYGKVLFFKHLKNLRGLEP